MKNLLFSIFFSTIVEICLFSAGCSTNPRYVEGTETAVGLYIPGDSNLYGLQVLHYLNGCVVRSSSNQCFSVEREYASTNNYFFLVNTVETSKTKVNVREKEENPEKR